ncbi:MAG TPA: hypothetical protein VG759_22105 [Candidatus Angelobacter sp.]|nr:hypothetical protein [Candidatus Angelobacter sp.]
MNRHWVGPSVLSVFLLMVLLPGSLSAQRRRGFDFRCSQVKSSFERQISTLKLQQQNDLNECRTAYGKKSDLCRDLKEQQKEAMNQLKYSRGLELRGCNQQPTIFTAEDVVVRPSQNTGGCGRGDGQTYVDNDDEKPTGKPPANNPGPAKIGPPETDGSPGTTANHPPAKIGPPEQDGSGTAGSPNQVRASHNSPRPMPADTGNSAGGSRSSGGFNSSANSSGNTHSSGSVHSSGSGNSSSSYSGGSSVSHGSSGGSYSGGGNSGGSSSASSASHSSGGSGASVSSAGASSANSGGGVTKH